MNQDPISFQVCIAGGGPAGIMLGYLMARSGIEVAVLEKWPDFFRDFRGDTIHPSTMTILDELGILDKFLKLPYTKNEIFEADIGKEKVTVADFSSLKVKAPFIAMIPQWDFLNFMSAEAKKYPSFHLMMQTEATDLLYDQHSTVIGLRAKNQEGEFEIKADLVIGCDGRHSLIREKAKLEVEDLGAPMDVLWFRIARSEDGPDITQAKANFGKLLIMINRRDYWQCAYIIRKGHLDELKKMGMEHFHKDLIKLVPELEDEIKEINDWSSLKLLSVTVDHLKKWYSSGVLCIGDSAHAMSPIGGVGINLAIQDAVAAGNILIPKILSNQLTNSDLAAVQKRRSFPTRIIQKGQVFIQDHVISRLLEDQKEFKTLPWPVKLLKYFPYLRRFPARIIGLGFRPEHIRLKFND